jgi:hypothetical protein
MTHFEVVLQVLYFTVYLFLIKDQSKYHYQKYEFPSPVFLHQYPGSPTHYRPTSTVIYKICSLYISKMYFTSAVYIEIHRDKIYLLLQL